MKRFKVTCKKCGGFDHLTIDPGNRVFYTKHQPIIAARYRPDENWGFECMCGNDSRLAPQEKEQVDILVAQASKTSVAQMVKNLERKPYTKFKMESA